LIWIVEGIAEESLFVFGFWTARKNEKENRFGLYLINLLMPYANLYAQGIINVNKEISHMHEIYKHPKRCV